MMQNEEEKYLFLVSIGPIQDFISSARSSRDLWFGSWLLSELAKTAARSIVEQSGNALDSLIFPAPEKSEDLKPNSTFNVGNKILAIVQENPQTLGTTVKEAIQKRLDAIREQTFKKIRGHMVAALEEGFSDKKNQTYFDRAKEQIDDLVEYYYVALPYDAGKYAETREKLEALMAARKVTRNFAAVTWGSNDPKSSLDGLRESVIPEYMYPERTEEKAVDKTAFLRERYGVRPGERLCGVGLLKRHGEHGKESEFLSTAHIAALPFLARLARYQSDEHKAAWDIYKATLEELGCVRRDIGKSFSEHTLIGRADGAIFFEDQTNELFDNPPQDYAKGARVALNAFLEATVGKEVRPSPYYALLLADGDRMGKIIDGLKNVDEHREFSKSLAGFADSVRKIVECVHKGALIYAGGDDVLALVPIHTVLDCADALARKFTYSVGATLSVGVAVTHYLEPLSLAMDLVRKAEKEAKKKRNSLAVIVNKRSGGERIVVGEWGKGDEQLRRFIQLHRDNLIPDGAAYELQELTIRVGSTLEVKALHAEATRILKRKRTTGGEGAIDDDTLEKLTAWITAGITSKNEEESKETGEEESEEDKRNKAVKSLQSLANALIVARLFADAKDMAEGPKVKAKGSN